MKLTEFDPADMAFQNPRLWRLRLLHAVAELLGIQLNYGLRFMPMGGARVRSRKVENMDRPHPATPYARFRWLMQHPEDRKESADGVYLLNIEASPAGFYHEARIDTTLEKPVAAKGQGGLLQGLPDTPTDGPAATVAAQAAADEPQGAAGRGKVGRRTLGPEAITGPTGPVDEVIPRGPLNEADSEQPIRTPTASLDQLGRR